MAAAKPVTGGGKPSPTLTRGGFMSIVMTMQRQTTTCADVAGYVRDGHILSVYGIKGPRNGSFLRLVQQLKRQSREVPCQIWIGATPVPAPERAWLAAVLTAVQHAHDCPQQYALAGLIIIANTVNTIRMPFTCTFDYSSSLGVIWPGRQRTAN